MPDIHRNDFFNLIKYVSDAMVVTNSEGKIVQINPQAKKIFGYSQEELLGEPVEILMPARFNEGHSRQRENYQKKPKARLMGQEIGILGRRKDGSEVPLDISLSPWGNGDESLVLCLVHDITDRKQAEEEVNRKNKNVQILNTVTQAVHKSQSLEEVYTIALDMATELDNVDMAFVYLVDKDRKEAVVQAHRNLPEDYIRRAQRIPSPKGVTWKVINTGEIENIENVQEDPNIGPAGRELGHHSALVIPVTSEEEVIGVLWFLSYKEREFDEDKIDLLTSIGDQIAIAISKAKLYKDLARKSRYEEIIRTVTQNVHSSIDLQEVFENAVGSLSENVDVVLNIGIYMVEGEEVVLKAQRGFTGSFLKRAAIIPYPKGFTWKTILEGKPRYCADTDEDEYIGPAGREEGIKSYLSMPISSEGKTVGCINITSKQKNAIDEQELQLLEVVSHQISIAINNAKQAEALHDQTVELEEANAELKDATQMMLQVEKMGAVGLMTAGVAHELNNPMMGILNYVQFCLERTDEEDKRYRYLQKAEKAAYRCVDIVKNLLTFTSFETGGEESFVLQSIHVIIDRIIDMISPRIEIEGIKVVINYEEGTPAVLMIESDLQQAFLNLMLNALDAVADSERKEIRIDVKQDGGFVRTSISDTGYGISADALSKIFDPFYTTKSVGKGTGLGLSVCRNIINKHGGEIECKSEPGSGTTFSVLLPVEQRKLL